MEVLMEDFRLPLQDSSHYSHRKLHVFDAYILIFMVVISFQFPKAPAKDIKLGEVI